MSSSIRDPQYEKMSLTPIPKLILGLSVPAIISMLVTNIYNLVDTAFVGKLGTSASGAVGIVFGFMTVIQAFGFMFGQGAGSILSRSLGDRDPQKASVHATAGFCCSFLFGVLICVFGFAFLEDIVYLLGSTDTIAPYAKTYISYILVSAPFMCSCLTLNNLLRYEGKAFLGMIGLMSGAVLNMAGDPILMFGLKMGISGAGLSTAVSQLVSWGILMGMFLSGKTRSELSLKNARLVTLPMIGNIIATGFPSLLRQALNSVTTMMLNNACSEYGDAAVAAMSIVSRIVFFAFSVALGVGQGFQPVSAFSYGAKKYTRLRKGFRFACIMSEAIIIVSSTVLIIFSGDLIGIFRDDADVIKIGTRALRLQALATVT
ncbi:MAG: MATE family efflux transporter, partial [Ruminococcus sp.]|nr:MATE family efflux transporter [Ruminococcus sp.]